jgi:DNA-binding CsgD family transcriptional regulator/PAS domain-containing protein
MSSASQSGSKLPATADNNRDRESLNDLISLVYDSVVDRSRWAGACARVAAYVGGVGIGYFEREHDTARVRIWLMVGIAPPPPDALYRQIYPALEGHFLGEIEQPVATSDLMPFDQLAETEFYRTWAEPQGLVDFVSVVLDRSAISAGMFGVFRRERDGLADDDARRRLRLLAPHLRRALLIICMFNRKAAEAATLADTLDGLSAGLCLVDAGGRIVHVNAAAQAMLDADDVLRSVEGRLLARDAQANGTLREVFAAAGQGDEALGTKGIAVPLTGEDGERYVAHALPLTSGARQSAGITHTAAAALFIRKTAPGLSARPEVIGEAFKLTPTELRVLLAIVELGSVPEVAAALGVADTTVRTHVGRLFEKTGARRQADLVKLVTGYATPLAD